MIIIIICSYRIILVSVVQMVQRESGTAVSQPQFLRQLVQPLDPVLCGGVGTEKGLQPHLLERVDYPHVRWLSSDIIAAVGLERGSCPSSV